MAMRKTKSNKKTKSKATRRNTKSALGSVASIKTHMANLQDKIKKYVTQNNVSLSELGKKISRQWAAVFNKSLSTSQAKSMAKHYMNMFGKSKRGGSLAGAPLDYTMGPGMPGATTYGVFPTEVGADPKATQHLDVYYNSGMGRSCGTENTTAIVPKDMGSNLVAKGGRRTKRRGGNFLSSLNVRSYTSSNPATSGQILGEAWAGKPTNPHNNPRPEFQAWQTVSNGKVNAYPSATRIMSDMTQIASPSPYPAVSPN